MHKPFMHPVGSTHAVSTLLILAIVTEGLWFLPGAINMCGSTPGGEGGRGAGHDRLRRRLLLKVITQPVVTEAVHAYFL
jgi:hypothetical protein